MILITHTTYAHLYAPPPFSLSHTHTQGTEVHVFQLNGVLLNSFQLLVNVTFTSIHYHSTTTSTFLVGSEVSQYDVDEIFIL